MVRESIELLKRSGNDSVQLSMSLRTLAVILEARGRPAEAESLLRDVLAMNTRLFGEESLEVGESELALGDMLSSQGKEQPAAETFLRPHQQVTDGDLVIRSNLESRCESSGKYLVMASSTLPISRSPIAMPT